MAKLGAHLAQPTVLSGCTATAIVHCSWAFATLQVRDPPLFSALATRLGGADLLPAFSLSQITTILWAYWACNASLSPPLRLLAARGHALVPDASGPRIAAFTWALARSGLARPEWLRDIRFF
eukprot:EG_transcript_53476